MVEQTARRTIRCVDWACETPRLGKQLSDSGGLHLSEVLATMDGPKVTQVSGCVELVGHNCETG